MRGYATTAPEGELAAQRPWVDECYAADTIEEIIDRLSNSGVTAAKETAAALLTASPTALKVTLAAVRRAGQLGSLEAVLDQEFRVSCRAFTGHDLTEGVRARIIDKDRTPRWTPAEIREVTAAEVARHFEPLGDRELGLSAS